MTPRAGRTAPYDPQILRQRRQDAGLTQTELARRIGLTKAFVSQLEQGASGASAESLARIAAALGCTVADLRRGGLLWELLPRLARAKLDGALHLCDKCLPGLLRLLAPHLDDETAEGIGRRWDELVDALAAGRDASDLLDALAGTDLQEH